MSSDNAIIDRTTFGELQEAAGADFVQELVQTFLEEAPPMLAELREAREQADADTFRRAAHSLKSNCLTFGATALAALARRLELEGLPAAQAAAGIDPLDALDAEYARAARALTDLAHE